MTSPGQVSEATQQAAGQTAGAAKQEAAAVGGTAVSAAGDVASTAKEQVGAVAGTAVDQVRGLADQARSQVTEQATTATSKLGESVRALVDELRQMSSSSSTHGPAAQVIGSVADRGEQLADYLGSADPGTLLQDLRAFAARRPGGFITGALLAGVATGRVVHGARTASTPEPVDVTATGGYASAGYPAATSTAYPAAAYPAADQPAAAYPAAAYPAGGTGITSTIPAGTPASVDFGSSADLEEPYPSASSSSTYGGMADVDPLAEPAYDRETGLR